MPMSPQARGVWRSRSLANSSPAADNVALSSRSADHLDAARATLLAGAPQARVLTIQGDISSVEDQERILARLDSDGFVPDIFVCSAGHPKNLHLSSLTRAVWESDLEMILGQAVFATQKFAPAMAERGYGRLIFLSSIYAKTPSRDFFMSSLARAGLFALSKILADEHASRGVASFVVLLGFIDTPMVRNLALGRPLDAPDPEAAVTASWASKSRGVGDRDPRQADRVACRACKARGVSGFSGRRVPERLRPLILRWA